MKFETILPLDLYSLQRENTSETLLSSLETISRYGLEELQGKLSEEHPYFYYKNDFSVFEESLRNTELPAELRAKIKGLYYVLRELLTQFESYPDPVKQQVALYVEKHLEKTPLEKVSLLVQELSSWDSTKDSTKHILAAMLNLH